jgi:CRISPR-associated helicase Cas3
VLNPKDGICTSPKEWLAHDFAKIAAGPVVVAPMTDAVLDYWSATTDARSPHLSPHPFLYGLAEDDEGTPLVGVAFRLEAEALRETTGDEDDLETPNTAAEVLEIFERFPPLRAELHQMKLSAVREWLASPEGEKHPLVYRSRDKWHAKAADESVSDATRALSPNSTLILPASALMRSKAFDSFMKNCQQSEELNTAISDVLEGVSDPQHARYLRTIEPKTGRTGGDGAWLWDSDAEEKDAPVAETDGYKRSLLKKLRVGGTEYTFRYFRPEYGDKGLQFLDDHNGTPGHLHRAENETIRIAEAIAPGDIFLRALLSTAALQHDEGKRHSHWQRAFGRRKESYDIAKLVPGLERPAPLRGFRHEWESLRKLVGAGTTPPFDIPPDSHALWRDLLLHLVGVHHGHLRPSISDAGLTPDFEAEKQNPLRLESAERFTRLQRQLGRWRLAYLEALLKTADAEGSRIITEEEPDGN